MLIGSVVALVGIGLDVGQTTGIILVHVPVQVSRTLWIVALIVTGLIAPFQAFQKVRRERDEARNKLASLSAPFDNELIVKARLNHFEKLTELAKSLESDLEDLNLGSNPPVSYRSGLNKPLVTFYRTEPKPLFAGLRSHVNNGALWDAFDRLKQCMEAQVEQAFVPDSEGQPLDYSNPNASGLDSRVMVEVPFSYGGSTDGRPCSVVFQLPDCFDVLVQELTRTLGKGIVGGSCGYCPDA